MTRPERNGGDRGYQLSPGRAAVVVVCLAAPIVALMWVGSYDRETPTLWGIPFFYWYQFLWVFLAPALTYLAYHVVTRARVDAGGRDRDGEAGS